jgi:hypothetical protein
MNATYFSHQKKLLLVSTCSTLTSTKTLEKLFWHGLNMPLKKGNSLNPIGALPIPLILASNAAGPPVKQDMVATPSEWTAPSSIQAQLEPTMFDSLLQTTPLHSRDEVADAPPNRKGCSHSQSLSADMPLRQQWMPHDYSAGIREAWDAMSKSHGMVRQITHDLGKLTSTWQWAPAWPAPDTTENAMYKGKTLDLHNWGGLNIPLPELDPDTQWAAFASYQGVLQQVSHSNTELRKAVMCLTLS